MLFCKFKMLLTSEEFYHKTPIVFTITILTSLISYYQMLIIKNCYFTIVFKLLKIKKKMKL